MSQLATSYEAIYSAGHPFLYRRWLYEPFIRAVVKEAGLNRGAKILDVGCGQGFFTALFADLGLDAVGVDSSVEGIRSAVRDYGFTGARFEVGDALSLTREVEFDAVFVRGLSLYNSTNLEQTHKITQTLLHYLKPDGVLIFAYGTNLSPRRKKESWIHHSLADAKKYFSSYPGARIYFSFRAETLLLRTWAFSTVFTSVFAVVSRLCGLGGELVGFIPRCSN